MASTEEGTAFDCFARARIRAHWLLRKDERLGKIALASGEIQDRWHQAEEQRAAAEVAEADRRHKAALANLQGKAAADRRTLTSLEPAPSRKFGDPLPFKP